ncbi:MAG TPA: class I adenylate-forming enzyme family protein [Xanthobacteraceae bacterium]|nr:class I adenylate-forming enzyme family protein [Xanthobacteraceae bacterium]
MLHTHLIAPIPELLKRHAQERGDKVAYRDAHASVTYAQLEARTARLAAHLADHGIAPGDTVAIFLPNSTQWIEACFAIARAGAISVPISYDASPPEIAYRLEDANCRGMVTTAERANPATVTRLKTDAPQLKTIIATSRTGRWADTLRYESLLATAPQSAPRDPPLMHEPAFILYTSGTTGRAKGVLLTVHGMLWIVAACWAPIAGLSERDTLLSPLPLFHSYALNLSVLGVLATGASEYIMERFSTAEAMRLLQTGEFTCFPGVPTMFHYLMQGAQAGSALPGLRLCISAGAIMPATLNREFEQRFGVPLLDGYGITETSTMVTMNWPTGGRVYGSCGFPVPGLAVRIVDPASGDDVAQGEEGELIVRGPNVMPGYLNKPEETAKALRNGWYHTGDLARADENNFLTITGRLKELIIRGGQNIAPAEIEEVVSTFDQVLDCAVVGAPHEHLGEVPVLFVVARANATVDTDALLAHCRAHLSAYKVPQRVIGTNHIPRTGSGKIMRYRLKEMLEQIRQAVGE